MGARVSGSGLGFRWPGSAPWAMAPVSPMCPVPAQDAHGCVVPDKSQKQTMIRSVPHAASSKLPSRKMHMLPNLFLFEPAYFESPSRHDGTWVLCKICCLEYNQCYIYIYIYNCVYIYVYMYTCNTYDAAVHLCHISFNTLSVKLAPSGKYIALYL